MSSKKEETETEKVELRDDLAKTSLDGLIAEKGQYKGPFLDKEDTIVDESKQPKQPKIVFEEDEHGDTAAISLKGASFLDVWLVSTVIVFPIIQVIAYTGMGKPSIIMFLMHFAVFITGCVILILKTKEKTIKTE